MDIAAIEAKTKLILDKNQISSPFVNVFDIAATEGIAIKYRKFPLKSRSVSGFYFPKDKTIYLNVDEPSERQVFTIAHELGHYFLDHKTNEYGVYKRENSYQGIKHTNEKEADCFAANLLMPKNMIQEELSRFPFIKEGNPAALLSLRFGVSNSAMTNRLKNLGIVKR
ncbi:MAG TPA: ImmA/IrrE family metallo-endopeptidase [Candidatus Saccharimonadales bacterium]|nr:ImmA/IrrE family metallo-endopeptidase [Candidatus Saccharimonadales bacterium]